MICWLKYIVIQYEIIEGILYKPDHRAQCIYFVFSCIRKTNRNSCDFEGCGPDSSSAATFSNCLIASGFCGFTLFDLAEGNTDILYASDGNWLGYHNQDFIIEMGFKKPVRLKEIVLSTLTSVGLESFPPSQVEIWVSSNGSSFSLAGKIKPGMPGEKSQVQHNLIACPTNENLPVTGLKIIAKPLEKLPSWHKNQGKPAWFFIDEILIN